MKEQSYNPEQCSWRFQTLRTDYPLIDTVRTSGNRPLSAIYFVGEQAYVLSGSNELDKNKCRWAEFPVSRIAEVTTSETPAVWEVGMPFNFVLGECTVKVALKDGYTFVFRVGTKWYLNKRKAARVVGEIKRAILATIAR